MHEPIDDILADLYELDPSLKERDVETRALVSAFQTARPSVVIDGAFVASLREGLIGTRLHPYHSEHHSARWWFLHLAPIGAVAMLTLTLVPGMLQETNVRERTLNAPLEVPERYGAPTAKQAGSEAAPSTFMMETTESDTSLTALPAAPVSGDAIVVLTQTPGSLVFVTELSLTAPGFLIINEARTHHTIGTSPLLGLGSTTNIPIPLTTPLTIGESYYATLVHDTNGNDTLDPADTPVLDPFTDAGLPIEDRVYTVPFDVFPALD